jgi:hypothetical protein
MCDGDDRKIVATGTWFYDKTVPMRVAIHAKEARFAFSRYNDEGQLDETRTIPHDIDRYLYCLSLATGGEYLTIEEAKASVDRQPWGPAKWD